jgi:hypothetical protein
VVTWSDLLQNALLPLSAPPLGAYGWHLVDRCLLHWLRNRFFADWLGIAAFDAAFGLMTRQWLYAACSGASFAAALVARWWWRRKDRKRAGRAFGYKGRALLAALVASLRESLRPRPVLKPQPGGAPG